MVNTLMVIGRALCILITIIVAVLVWKTVEHLKGIPEKYQPLIAWDALMLFGMLIFLVVRLIMA